MLKTIGYVISTISVLLLAAAAWPGAAKETATLVALILGVPASIIGMGCRWVTYVIEHRQKLQHQGIKSGVSLSVPQGIAARGG